MTAPAIEVEGLRRTYRVSTGAVRRRTLEVEAVRGISFSVGEGELFGLLGPNGAGKTTTIKILITLLVPTSGAARVLGYDVVRQPREVRKRIGYVFGGDRGLYDRLSGLDNLRYFAELYGVPLLVARAGAREGTLLYASLDAGVMGIWSSTLFGSGGAISWARREGTLEVLVASLAGYFWVLLPQTIATASIRLYSLVATLVWGRLLFDVPFAIAHPLAFVVSIPVTVLGLGMLGLLMASTFVLYRHANALSNMLEFPVLFVSGLLVRLSALPVWVRPVGWLLAPTWGMRAVRAAALGGNP